MSQYGSSLIFPLVGTFTSLLVTGYYIYKMKEGKGLFRGSLDDYLSLTIEYSIVSGLMAASFFAMFLLPNIFFIDLASGVILGDLFFLAMTFVWMFLAHKIFGQMSEMSEKYFAGGGSQ